MTNITSKIARCLALPILAAGIAGGAALGMASTASAAPVISSNDSGNFFAPTTHATPAPSSTPGAQAHRHHHQHHFGI
jgi:hypothetical protein